MADGAATETRARTRRGAGAPSPVLAGAFRAREIPVVFGPPSPQSLAVHTLPFRALASLAARSPMGGEREVVLGCFVAARLVALAAGPHAAAAQARRERATAARAWFAGLTLPATLRTAFARLVDATGGDDAGALAQPLAVVIDATRRFLDDPSRAELERLAEYVGCRVP